MAAIDCYGYFVYDTSYAYIIGIYLEDPILSATLLTRISYFSVSVSPCSNCKKKNALNGQQSLLLSSLIIMIIFIN